MADLAWPRLTGRRRRGIIPQSDSTGGMHRALSPGHRKLSPLGPLVGQIIFGRLKNQERGELETSSYTEPECFTWKADPER